MLDPSRLQHVLRRALAWSLGWILAGALYLLLIDITDLPELIVGAGAAVLAATGYELAREQHLGSERIRLRWLVRVHRPLLNVPPDIVRLGVAAVRQLFRRDPSVGSFRTVSFASLGSEEDTAAAGRRALAEVSGSFAPNTFVVGIDQERQLILAHQLRRTPGRKAIDPLELG
jgi:hypothetical protein